MYGVPRLGNERVEHMANRCWPGSARMRVAGSAPNQPSKIPVLYPGLDGLTKGANIGYIREDGLFHLLRSCTQV